MTNTGVILTYLPFLICSLGISAYSLVTNRLGRYTGTIVFMTLSFAGWLGSASLYFGSSTAKWSTFFYDMELPFVALSSLSVFLLTMKFYNLDHYLSREIRISLLIIPCITAIMSLTASHHDFLRTSFELIQITPLHIATRVRGPWFWVHAVFSYLMAMASLAVAFVQHRKISRVFRTPSRLLLLAMFLSISGNVLVLTNAFPIPLDFSLLCGCGCSLLLFYICVRNRGIDYMNHARNNIFHFLKEAILILDDEGTISSANRQASQWLRRIGIPPDSNYATARTRLEEFALSAEASGLEDGGTDYTVPHENGTRIINIRKKEIDDNRGRAIGAFIICSDATKNRTLIRNLEDGAGIDALTGLANRRRMDSLLQELDTADNLPLSVIMGDLNYLKTVNDTMGHQQGDVLLRAASEILVSSCPPSAHIGRIGGDEYLILLPSTSKEQTGDILRQIRQNMAGATGYPFEVSMALGSAVKEDAAASLEQAVKQADDAMYENKRLTKKSRVG